MAGGIRRKKNNPSKKRDKRLGPIKVVYTVFNDGICMACIDDILNERTATKFSIPAV